MVVQRAPSCFGGPHPLRRLAAAWVLVPALACAQGGAETRGARTTQRDLLTVAPVAASAAAGRAEEAPTRRLALVVGNAGYRFIPSLKNSGNDARDMCAALARLGFETTCLQDVATVAEFRRAVRLFSARLDPQTAALFYYAGHGVQVNGRNHLLPTGIAAASSAELESASLGLDEVFAQLRQGRAAVNIVVLDACRDDPFDGRQGMSVSRGLAREDPPTDAVLVYATAPGAVAVDGKGRNGLFTSHLLAEIERPGPQIGELFRSVARQVEQEARSRYGLEQVPYRSFSYSGVFCFAACDDARIAAQVDLLRQQSAAALRRIQELESARAQPGETVQRESADRLAEIRTLRAQLAELAAQSSQLETYRQRIAALEKEAREKDQRLAEGAKKDEARRSRPTVVPTF